MRTRKTVFSARIKFGVCARMDQSCFRRCLPLESSCCNMLVLLEYGTITMECVGVSILSGRRREYCWVARLSGFVVEYRKLQGYLDFVVGCWEQRGGGETVFSVTVLDSSIIAFSIRRRPSSFKGQGRSQCRETWAHNLRRWNWWSLGYWEWRVECRHSNNEL